MGLELTHRDMASETSFKKNHKIKISQDKLNNRVMRKRSKVQQHKEHNKPSSQKVLYKLDKGFERKLKLLLNVTPEQVEELKAKWKKERGGKRKQISN